MPRMTTRRAESLLKKLLALTIASPFDSEEPVTPHAFIRSDSPTVVRLSAEEGDGLANYYGPQGWAEIHPAVEAFAKANGCFWEWEDPGSIALYEV